MSGKVYLVGSGPGDPGLITVKGLEIIRSADCIIYDYLANPALLGEARPDAEVIYAGKRVHHHHIDQDAINALLVEKAGEGKVICRLKGGDPFVFGRGGEECLALVDAGIRFEIVPGVSSTSAVPAYAGIPITHRGIASDVAFVTGHEGPDKDISSIDWEKLALGVGTLVFVMGITNLPTITKELISNGRDPETPVALIRWGTTAKQQTLIGTLADIADKAAAHGFKPPAIIVIGDVVKLREKLSWVEDLPLFGRRVIVTRAQTQTSKFSRALRELGAEPVEIPMIRTIEAPDYSTLDEAIVKQAKGASFDWIILTSVNGVTSFIDRLSHHGLDVRALAGSKIVAVGPATAKRARAAGIHPDLVPANYIAEGVLETMKDHGVVAGQTVLMPRALVAREFLPKELTALGLIVTDAAAYETVPAANSKELLNSALASETIDYVTFTSSSTASNFCEMIDDKSQLGDVKVVSIGAATSQTLRDNGMPVHIEATVSTIPGMVDAIQADVS